LLLIVGENLESHVLHENNTGFINHICAADQTTFISATNIAVMYRKEQFNLYNNLHLLKLEGQESSNAYIK